MQGTTYEKRNPKETSKYSLLGGSGIGFSNRGWRLFARSVHSDIGEELGVSRTALREAFKLLTAKRLIESRPKLGTRVRPRKNWNMFDAEVLRWCFSSNPDTQFYMALYEMREIIEPNAGHASY